jgi:hypothetical protein
VSAPASPNAVVQPLPGVAGRRKRPLDWAHFRRLARSPARACHGACHRSSNGPSTTLESVSPPRRTRKRSRKSVGVRGPPCTLSPRRRRLRGASPLSSTSGSRPPGARARTMESPLEPNAAPARPQHLRFPSRRHSTRRHGRRHFHELSCRFRSASRLCCSKPRREACVETPSRVPSSP